MRKGLLFILMLSLLLAGCARQSVPETTTPTTLPPTTAAPTVPAPVLRSGCYLLEQVVSDGVEADAENVAAVKSYLYLAPDGSGTFSMMGAAMDLTWQEDGPLSIPGAAGYEIEGDCITLDLEVMVLTYRYHGDELPEEYLSVRPLGYFLVSSVGIEGDVTFYSTADPANGYLYLHADGTGTLFFLDVTADLTLDDEYIYWNDREIPYLYYTPDQSPDGDALLMLFFTEEQTSVAMRIAPPPAE